MTNRTMRFGRMCRRHTPWRRQMRRAMFTQGERLSRDTYCGIFGGRDPGIKCISCMRSVQKRQTARRQVQRGTRLVFRRERRVRTGLCLGRKVEEAKSTLKRYPCGLWSTKTPLLVSRTLETKTPPYINYLRYDENLRSSATIVFAVNQVSMPC